MERAHPATNFSATHKMRVHANKYDKSSFYFCLRTEHQTYAYYVMRMNVAAPPKPSSAFHSCLGDREDVIYFLDISNLVDSIKD